MSYFLCIIILGIFSLNIYLVLLGIFMLLIQYLDESIDKDKDRLIQEKKFNNELKKAGRLN